MIAFVAMVADVAFGMIVGSVLQSLHDKTSDLADDGLDVLRARSRVRR